VILNYPRERSTIASLRHPNGRTAMTPAAPRSGSIMRSLARVLLVLSAFAVPSSAGATADDHFAQLGVPFGAPMEDVKAQFRKLARQYHPDKNKNNDSTASEKFLRISEAHAILTDEAKRAEARAASAPARLPRPPQPHGRGGARVFRAVRWRRSSRRPRWSRLRAPNMRRADRSSRWWDGWNGNGRTHAWRRLFGSLVLAQGPDCSRFLLARPRGGARAPLWLTSLGSFSHIHALRTSRTPALVSPVRLLYPWCIRRSMSWRRRSDVTRSSSRITSRVELVTRRRE
jgi:DnaJ-domain-containing protein 1